jgi:hypothetical protein
MKGNKDQEKTIAAWKQLAIPPENMIAVNYGRGNNYCYAGVWWGQIITRSDRQIVVWSAWDTPPEGETYLNEYAVLTKDDNDVWWNYDVQKAVKLLDVPFE